MFSSASLLNLSSALVGWNSQVVLSSCAMTMSADCDCDAAVVSSLFFGVESPVLEVWLLAVDGMCRRWPQLSYFGLLPNASEC